MATPTEDSNYSLGLEKLMEEVTCPVCQELYEEPKLLPCLHCYCRHCLENLIQRGPHGVENLLLCPECRGESQLSTEDVKNLPTAFYMNRLKSVYLTMSKSQSLTELACEKCGSDQLPAKWFCQQCSQMMCELCTRTHQKLPSYRDHIVISKEDPYSLTNQLLPVLKSDPSWCKEHSHKLNLFCLDCQKLVCRQCIEYDHENHDYEFVKKMAGKIKQDITNRLQRLTNTQEALAAKREHLTQVKTDISSSAKERSDFVNHSIDELVKLYETCRKELHEKIEKESQEKLTQLSAAEKHLAILSSELQNLVSFIKNTLDFGTDTGIISIDSQISSEIDQYHDKCACLEKECHTGELSTSKEECVAIIASIASTCIAADPDKCSLAIDPAQVGKPMKMKLHLVTTSNQPCYAKQLLNITIKSLKKHYSCDAKVTETSPGVMEISYTPRLRGRHVVSVLVNGNPIVGSPFQFHVKPLMNQMQTPTQEIPMADMLGDIAVTESGDLLITLPEKGAIVKLDTESMQREVVASGFNHPVGIAIGKNNEIYITERQAHRLQKLNQNFRSEGFVGHPGTTPGCFNAPGTLVVNHRGEIIVCDQFNSRVQIFNSKLQFQRWYGVARPLGVACGKRDEIFVTESTRNRVCKIYDKSLGIQEFCKNLDSPRGVFVSGDHVYVTEEDQIAVYTVSGQYYGSLGNAVLKKACQVTGDKDDYLYVYDREAEAIFVF